MWNVERLLGKSCELRFWNHTRYFECQINNRGKKQTIPFQNMWMEYDRKLPVFLETTLRAGRCKDMTPQGLCVADGYILISAYCGGRAEENHVSVIYVLSAEGEHLQTWELPFRAHTGGIAYDGRNLWVCSGGNTISAFAFDECRKLLETHESQRNVSIKSAFQKKVKTDTTTSFCTYDNQYLWTGKFSAPPVYNGEPWIYGYPLMFKDADTLVETGENVRISIPSVEQVQGVCFAEHQGKKYILLSKSYGKYFASHIEIFEYRDEREIRLEEGMAQISITLPPMLEQITAVDGKIYMMFESSARKFYKPGRIIGNCRFPVNRLCVMDFQKMMQEI